LILTFFFFIKNKKFPLGMFSKFVFGGIFF